MKNADSWRPSKFVLTNGKLSATRDTRELAIGSRLIASLIATRYDESIRKHARGRLVDLGCGKAPLFGLYSQYTTHAVTVDWPRSPHGLRHVDYECDLSSSLPFDDSEFHTVILSDVLEHITEPQKLCNEIARILTPGGKLLLNVPFLYKIHERPHDYFRYTDEGLRHLLTRSGLSVLELAPIGGSLEVLSDLLAKNVTRIPFIGRLLSWSIQDATLWFARTTLGHRIALESGRTWPLGYFVIAVK